MWDSAARFAVKHFSGFEFSLLPSRVHAQVTQTVGRTRSIEEFTVKRLYTVMCGLLLVSCGFSPTQSSSIHEPNFESLSGSFAIWMPADVEQNDEIRPGTCVGTTRDIHFFFARGNGVYWLVQYCELSEPDVNKLTDREILDQARHEALASAFGILKKETEITLNGYPGRHIIADSALRTSGMEKPDGAYKARVFLVGNRVYRIATYVFNNNSMDDFEKMDVFLESFILLKQ